MSPVPRTLFAKIWDDHVVAEQDGWTVLSIDRHLGHDGTSRPLQMLHVRGGTVRRPDRTVMVLDHVVPTVDQTTAVLEPDRAEMVEQVRSDARRYGFELYDIGDPRNGIAHVVGPERGLSLPGTTIACGDSHTSTHGALGALAFGIGASDVTHVLATQCLRHRRPDTMLVRVDGALAAGVHAKDVALAVVGRLGTAGATGHAVEYAGSTVLAMSMSERMTLCNMSTEAGARLGVIAPDDTTYAYLDGRPHAPGPEHWEEAVAHWRTLPTDVGAAFDRTVAMTVDDLAPQVTWGTTPAMVASVEEAVPEPADEAEAAALDYMALEPGTPIQAIGVDRVFIGSCTNSRLEDLRSAAAVIDGRRVAPGVHALVVPGSGAVKAAAEREGLDEAFRSVGFEWRDPGCSMCVGMNGDVLAPGERCVSTSNRNYRGRMGPGGRVHLASPVTAALAAVHGHIVDPRPDR